MSRRPSAVPVIPLKSWRLAPRKPWLAVEGGLVTFRFPSWFGGRTFSTPVANVGVVDLDAVGEPPLADDVVFEVPVVVPYVYTTNAVTAPNLGLVFREPLRLPRFRWFVQNPSEIAPKRGASGALPAGRYVDGMLLRAVEPGTAVAALAAAGAERIDEPEAWFVANRALVTDPDAVARVEREERENARAERVFWVLTGGGLAAAAWGGLTGNDVSLNAGMVASAAGLGVNVVWGWWAERRAFRPRGGRRPDADG